MKEMAAVLDPDSGSPFTLAVPGVPIPVPSPISLIWTTDIFWILCKVLTKKGLGLTPHPICPHEFLLYGNSEAKISKLHLSSLLYPLITQCNNSHTTFTLAITDSEAYANVIHYCNPMNEISPM